MKILVIICSAMFVSAVFGQSNDRINIYDKISGQLCNCLSSVNIMDSTQRKEYCYELILNKNYKELKTYGVDTLKNTDFKKYYDLYLKRFKNSLSKRNNESGIKPETDDSFVGSFIAQEKMPGGYNITLRSNEHRVTRSFISAEPIDEKKLKRFVKGEDDIILSYGTISQNGEEKYVVKSIVYLGKEKK